MADMFVEQPNFEREITRAHTQLGSRIHDSRQMFDGSLADHGGYVKLRELSAKRGFLLLDGTDGSDSFVERAGPAGYTIVGFPVTLHRYTDEHQPRPEQPSSSKFDQPAGGVRADECSVRDDMAPMPAAGILDQLEHIVAHERFAAGERYQSRSRNLIDDGTHLVGREFPAATILIEFRVDPLGKQAKRTAEVTSGCCLDHYQYRPERPVAEQGSRRPPVDPYNSVEH